MYQQVVSQNLARGRRVVRRNSLPPLSRANEAPDLNPIHPDDAVPVYDPVSACVVADRPERRAWMPFEGAQSTFQASQASTACFVYYRELCVDAAHIVRSQRDRRDPCGRSIHLPAWYRAAGSQSADDYR
jgi:hypothetical protein